MSSHAKIEGQLTLIVDLSRYILFALTSRQERLFRDLQTETVEEVDIQRTIVSINSTKSAATSCLRDLENRIQRRASSPRLTLQEKTALLMDYQNLCSSAVLYLTGQASLSQLAAISIDHGKSSCHHCRATMIPSKIRVPGAGDSSFVLMNLSGLFRAHCKGGSGWRCIWQLRQPSCYGVFPDVKALLKHMLAVHLRDDGNGSDIKVDWPADNRRGDLEKCGYSVRIDGLQMRKVGGNLVVPRRVSVVSQISLVPVSNRIAIDDPERLRSSLSTIVVNNNDIGTSESDDVSPISSTADTNTFEEDPRLSMTGAEIYPSEPPPSYEDSNAIFELETRESGQRVEVESEEVFEMDAARPRERTQRRRFALPRW